MNLEEMKIKKLLKSTEMDIISPTNLKQQILADILETMEETEALAYPIPNNFSVNLLKITFPITIFLTMLMGLQAY